MSSPNAQQITYWNETAGPKWVAMQAILDAQIEPLGRRAMDRARIVAGERVLDVGCGCGQTSLELARRVGPSGAVTSVDVSAPMLDQARRNAAAAGVSNVTFRLGDAQTEHFGAPSHDLLFSRFGVMFFADPAAAFANMRRALRPTGRLAFVCWQSVFENPWMLVPLQVVSQHTTLPAPPGPGAPGPFAFSDPDRVRDILATAGFREIAIDDVREELLVGEGRDLDAVVDFVLQLGPVSAAMRESNLTAGSPQCAALVHGIREALAEYQTLGGVRMASATWIVTANV